MSTLNVPRQARPPDLLRAHVKSPHFIQGLGLMSVIFSFLRSVMYNIVVHLFVFYLNLIVALSCSPIVALLFFLF